MDIMKKAAFVVLAGRPSVGKSTLVNLLCGAKIAIVSSAPQTTRNSIRGILTKPEGQLVFVDTPGRHLSKRKFNMALEGVSDRALLDAELVLYVLDAARAPGEEEEAVALRLQSFQDRMIIAINKTDSQGSDPDSLIAFLSDMLPDIKSENIFLISCLKKEGTYALLSRLFDMAAPGIPFYPEEYYTDQELSFRVAEIIREKAMNRLREELPHSIYVEIADMELREDGRAKCDQNDEAGSVKKRLWVRAFIITERESQKGMIVGKGGEKIKAIGLAARKELNSILDWKVDLDLRVKTGKDWRHNDKLLKKLTS